jgi:hypothetical protein
MKTCLKCKLDKPLEDFHTDKRAKDGHLSICKICRSRKKAFHPTLSKERRIFDRNLNGRLYRSLKTGKRGKWESFLGYTLEQLKQHLEKQFTSKMMWQNYGSYWWIDRIIPRAAYRYQNVKNNEFGKCWSLKNTRPLSKFECVKKSNKVLRELIEQYNLFDILPLGLIAFDDSRNALIRNELDKLLKDFVDKFMTIKYFDKDLYVKIIDVATAWNKAEILNSMVKTIELFQDYEENQKFDYTPFLESLLR